MNTRMFYNTLKTLYYFKDILNIENYKSVPEDWYIIVTDIKGSTQAIEAGRYKDVNFVGAMSIIAMLNVAGDVEIPFVFGGDGASILIPNDLHEVACTTLANLRELVKKNYGFELRVGLIPVSEIYQHNRQILITKYEVSQYYVQAIIQGGGFEYADYLLKQRFDEYKLTREATDDASVDFNGLECRWKAIPSPKDEVLSLLVKANDANSQKIYTSFLSQVEKILGSSLERNPVQLKAMELSLDTKNLATEASLYSNRSGIKFLYTLKMIGLNILGKALMFFNIGQWGGYKKHVFQTADTEKFDDMFRMVVSTNKEQTQALQDYLQSEYKKNNLVYGIHKSKASLMTCLVFQRHGKHVHFIDGSDGGYAYASKDYKKRAFR